MADMFQKLSAPFAPSKVSWRVGRKKKDNPLQGTALCYIDARDVMARLDEVCGPAGWSDSYTETARGRLLCTISIRVGDEWISKADGAGDTQVEGEKGAISDAFKRAAVKWGIGRYLYDIEAQWVDLDKWGGILPASRPKLDRALPGSRVPDIEQHDDNGGAQRKDPPPFSGSTSKTDGAPSLNESRRQSWEAWVDGFKADMQAKQLNERRDFWVEQNGNLQLLKTHATDLYDGLCAWSKALGKKAA